MNFKFKSSFIDGDLFQVFECGVMCHFHTGNADEGNQLFRNALQVLTDSKCMPVDDHVMERMIDLPELLHLVGRYAIVSVQPLI